MGGAAIIIGLQQLRGFLGIKHFTKNTDVVSVLKSWNWQTIVIGASFLALLLSAKYLAKKNKKLLTLKFLTPLFEYTPNAILSSIIISAVVSISFAKILLQVTRPRTAILGRISMMSVYRNIQQYPEATKVPGVLVVRVDSAIYFSNSNYIKERKQNREALSKFKHSSV
ncbi:STAS domain-containing protein, partial [Cynara cardunculus var. scolymus]